MTGAGEAGSKSRPAAGATVEWCVELICNKGCRAVRADIEALEQGRPVAGLGRLPEALRRQVLAELKEIMAVYGDSCRL